MSSALLDPQRHAPEVRPGDEVPPPFGQRVLEAWARIAVRLFYRRVHLRGPRAGLEDRPVVLAVNHSNALGDVALLVAAMPRFPRFLAASTWWRHAPVRLLFRIGRVLPVHRRDDGPAGDRNSATFEACTEALANGDHVAIFPEGRLNLGPGLVGLRTGAARIALASLAGGVRGVLLVPVALVYEDRGRLRSDVAIRFGEPIEVDDWAATAEEDPFGAAREVTDLLGHRLADSVAAGTADLAACLSSEVDRGRVVRELLALAPVAAAGVVMNAPAVVPIAVGSRLVPNEGWRATAKGVGATFLLPVAWVWSVTVTARRRGPQAALAWLGAAVASGWASLHWIERLRDLSRGTEAR